MIQWNGLRCREKDPGICGLMTREGLAQRNLDKSLGRNIEPHRTTCIA